MSIICDNGIYREMTEEEQYQYDIDCGLIEPKVDDTTEEVTTETQTT